MKPLTKLAQATREDGSLLELWERDSTFMLTGDGMQLGTSFAHGGDDAMAQIAAAPMARANQPTFLIAGLGLGHSLAALQSVIHKEKARFVIAEPQPELPAWNKTFLASLHPGSLDDPRVEIEQASAIQIARHNPKTFHAILFKSLHERFRLPAPEASDLGGSLRGGGLLLILIARQDKRLERTLLHTGYDVTTDLVPASHKGKQTRFHHLVIARKGHYSQHSAPQR